MTITITDDDIQSVFDELELHKETMPFNHVHCELCNWLQEFLATQQSQTLAEMGGNSEEYVMRLFFLYCGIRIGRRQSVGELIETPFDIQSALDRVSNDITAIFHAMEEFEDEVESVKQRLQKLEEKGEDNNA